MVRNLVGNVTEIDDDIRGRLRHELHLHYRRAPILDADGLLRVYFEYLRPDEARRPGQCHREQREAAHGRVGWGRKSVGRSCAGEDLPSRMFARSSWLGA